MRAWECQMIDVVLTILALCAGAGIWHLFTRPSNPRPEQPRRAPVTRLNMFNERIIPGDATHIAWIMLGSCEHGTVHTLCLQDLNSLDADIKAASSPIGPCIVKSIELELDMRERGCTAASELMYAIARIDREGNETWLSNHGEWVCRWSKDADIQNIFGEQRTVTM